ncbi:unnamed protein product [Caenorhabditis bovis]|uniref:Methyltransferase domain-containing protein n=1 Tax=Caenorhabditis bovis TaxID=2654633 RepID=A0A8S1EQ39_9PELO|nr:unnamed protein product [Caenorhabditis bovis]
MQIALILTWITITAGLSNHPKLLLISFDGFRNDLLNEELVPNIYKFATKSTWFTSGVKSQYLTYTAPNHMSISTGLYEENHGIVANYFFDEYTKKSFDYFNMTGRPGVVNASQEEFWYQGDPIWLTNERWETTRRSAALYWPNGDSPFPYIPHKPKYSKSWKTYGNLNTWMKDADEVIELFMREKDPMNFVAWYIAEPDHVLHTNGFHNGELKKKLTELDKLFRYFIERIEANNLSSQINIILTADHGHAEIKDEKHVMCIHDYVSANGFEMGDHMIYPHSKEIAEAIFHNLTEAVKKNQFEVDVHWKKDVPTRFHYQNSTRIGEIVFEPRIGSAISFSCRKEQLEADYGINGTTKFNSSTHGMDPDRPEMRAFLIMNGPAFSENFTIADIPENIDLYGLMCHVLNITPSENDGSMGIVKRALRENRYLSPIHGYMFIGIVDSMSFLFILVPSMCIVILFLIYGCRHTVMKNDPNWGRSEHSHGYRPLDDQINRGFRLEDEDDEDVESGLPQRRNASVPTNTVSMSGLLDEIMGPSVLPKTATAFTDPLYWKNFFAQRKTPFEWYGDYNSLSPVLEKYIKPLNNVLQIGCGSSELASQLYDNGYRSIHSIDVEPSVIADQKRRNKERPDLSFAEGDATNLEFANESYAVVLDKGTLDALLPPNPNDDQKAIVLKMFSEVHRVLLSGGRYLIVTLAQPHLIDFWLAFFVETKQYILRVQKVENKAGGFPMPVFVLIATKMRCAMPTNLPLEVWRTSSEKAERISNMFDLKATILAEQEIAQFIHLCSKKLKSEVSIDFQGDDPTTGPRYRICVIDNPDVTVFKKFATFIVPIGRDAEWMFATPKGRQALRAQCGHDRLVTVFLSRQHSYGNIEVVKGEIGHFVSLLDIRSEEDAGFDILSVGGIDVKKPVANGRSEINGEWSVEEVPIDGKITRRLVFINTMNLVQSEAIIKSGKKGKKVVDLDNLACEFHTMMIAGLSLSPTQALMKNDVPMKIAVLGLGGGLLTAYLLRQFKKSMVTGVELDPTIIRIANDYFSFPHSDSRVDIKCEDALVFLKNIADGKDKYDAIFIDVSGNQDAALSCPPPSFLTEEALCNLTNSLKEDGIALMNLVTRDDRVAQETKEKVAKHFGAIYTIFSSEDVNEVIICQKIVSTKPVVPSKLVNQVRKDIASYSLVCGAINRIRKY